MFVLHLVHLDTMGAFWYPSFLWILIYLWAFKGIKSTGKVVHCSITPQKQLHSQILSVDVTRSVIICTHGLPKRFCGVTCT